MKLVTLEDEKKRMEEYIYFMKHEFRVNLEFRDEMISLRNIISTQPHIEKDKYLEVLELVREGKLDVPVLIEEHFEEERDVRYMIDGHTRGRVRLDLGKTYTDAFVLWSEGGDFYSGLSDFGKMSGYIKIGEMQIK